MNVVNVFRKVSRVLAREQPTKLRTIDSLPQGLPVPNLGRVMIRFIFPVLASAALIATPVLKAQDVDAEDVRLMKSKLETVLEANDSMRGRIQNLEAEISRLKSEQARLRADMGGVGKDNVTQDQLKKVVDQLREVDKKRESDNRALLERMDEVKNELRKLAAAAAAAPVVAPEPVKPQGNHKPKSKPVPVADSDSDGGKAAPTTNAPAVPKSSLPAEYDYVEHVVASGETVGTIISAYNKEKGLKIRTQHVLDANPKLKPEHLKVGQKIKIPLIK